jgi:hypothetical protein
MTDILAYGQPEPTEETALRALTDLFGPQMAEATWATAVRAAGLTRPLHSIDDVQKAAEELTRLGDRIARVAGRSLRVRVIAYRALSGWSREGHPAAPGRQRRGPGGAGGGVGTETPPVGRGQG